MVFRIRRNQTCPVGSTLEAVRQGCLCRCRFQPYVVFLKVRDEAQVLFIAVHAAPRRIALLEMLNERHGETNCHDEQIPAVGLHFKGCLVGGLPS